VRIIVCGGRRFNDKELIREVLSEYVASETTIIHGAAKGADHLAGEVAVELGMEVIAVPADWSQFGNRAGPMRNRKMASEFAPDLVIGMPGNVGTKDMIQVARVNGIPVRLVPNRPIIAAPH